MRISLIAASLLAVTVLAACNSGRPISSRHVDQSVLPAQAKSLLAADAQITSVDEEMYKGGSRKYVIHYTLNGQSESIKYLDKQTSDAHTVFERN